MPDSESPPHDGPKQNGPTETTTAHKREASLVSALLGTILSFFVVKYAGTWLFGLEERTAIYIATGLAILNLIVIFALRNKARDDS